MNPITPSSSDKVQLTFSNLAALPDPVGFAGMAAGMVGTVVVAVGGAHFPDKKPWEGGVKVYNKSVYALKDGAWSVAGELPGVLAYAAYAGTPAGLVVAGGTDDRANFRTAFIVDADARFKALPELPSPVAFAGCAVVRDTLYLVGGTDSPTAVTALNSVYALDLTRLDAGWTTLAPIPGAGRHLSVAAAHDGRLLVFGGCSLAPRDGKPYRTYLREALSFDPASGAWTRLADLPESLVATAGPAPMLGDAVILAGGDTGFFYDNGKSPAEHPGQPRTITAYFPATDAYAVVGELPEGVVTAPAVDVGGESVLLISGETGPGRRTNKVTKITRL